MAESVFASSAAEGRAADLGLTIERITTKVEPTGKGGRITLQDVLAAAPPQPPDELGDAGRKLWRQALASLPPKFELDEREEAILALAARQADDLAALEAVIGERGVMAVGSTGQPVVNPAVQEARQARVTIGRLLGQLGLPDEAGLPGEASRRGKKAAQARWANRGARGAGSAAEELF